MDLDKAIQSRKSVRKFTSRVPDWKKIVECIDAARYAPCAGNNFTTKFILVDDKEIIESLAGCCQQDFIAQAHYVVVVCSDTARTMNAYGKERGERYCRQQAGAAIENFLLKIQEKGLSTCWVGHFPDEMAKRELKIPEEVMIEAIFPVGYEFGKQKERKKASMDSIIFFNKYKNKKMGKKESINA